MRITDPTPFSPDLACRARNFHERSVSRHRFNLDSKNDRLLLILRPRSPMSSQSSTHLTDQTAQGLLRQFICVDRQPSSPQLDYATVREALLWVVDRSDFQLFGICADNLRSRAAGSSSLFSRFRARAKDRRRCESSEGVVYLKYNPKTGRCHAEPYTGNHRGVLVSCQSAEEDDINETFGHLPIDLFGA